MTRQGVFSDRWEITEVDCGLDVESCLIINKCNDNINSKQQLSSKAREKDITIDFNYNINLKNTDPPRYITTTSPLFNFSSSTFLAQLNPRNHEAISCRNRPPRSWLCRGNPPASY